MNPKATSSLRNGNRRRLHCAAAPGPAEPALLLERLPPSRLAPPPRPRPSGPRASPSPPPATRHGLVPKCELRLLGTQRCPDCGSFMTKLGLGGLCSNCDEPVTFDELLAT